MVYKRQSDLIPPYIRLMKSAVQEKRLIDKTPRVARVSSSSDVTHIKNLHSIISTGMQGLTIDYYLT